MFDAFDRVGSAAESGDRLPSKTRSRSPASVLNSLVWRRGFEATESIPYGEGARRTLDIYRPNAATASPVVVFFYGGNWQSGDKEMYLFLAAALARRGYVTVVPDYRVYPGARYPQFIEDGALAVRWVRDNAARFGGDPQRLFVMGHSAGAYIAAMLAFDRRWLRAVGLSPGRDIAGLICIAGPYDFLPLEDETLKVIFGGANAPATQPISYVSGGEPPTLLATGADDGTVDPGNAIRLAARLRAAGCDVKVATYARVGHLGIIGAFAFPLRLLAPILNDVDAFITKLAPKQASRAARDVGLVS
jgi:acetyl esterase/lipase